MDETKEVIKMLNDVKQYINCPIGGKKARLIYAIDRSIELIKERKTGTWRHYERALSCSECKTEFYDEIMEYCGDDVPKFCPLCGSNMINCKIRETTNE